MIKKIKRFPRSLYVLVAAAWFGSPQTACALSRRSPWVSLFVRGCPFLSIHFGCILWCVLCFGVAGRELLCRCRWVSRLSEVLQQKVDRISMLMKEKLSGVLQTFAAVGFEHIKTVNKGEWYAVAFTKKLCRWRKSFYVIFGAFPQLKCSSCRICAGQF